MHTSTKRQAWKLKVKQNNDHGMLLGVSVLRKAIAVPLWSAIDSRWNWNAVSLVSPVTTVMHLPSSCMSSTESWFHAPAVSTATGKKWVVDSASYLITLLADALLAATPGSLAVWPRCDSAKVSGTVTSHAMGLPRAHGISVVPYGCLPSCCSKLTGSLIIIIFFAPVRNSRGLRNYKIK